jgi:hypothetical protein
MKDRGYGEGITFFHVSSLNTQTNCVCTTDDISICPLLTLKPVAVGPDGACVLSGGIVRLSVGSAEERFVCHVVSRTNTLLLLARILFVFHYLLVHYIFFTASLMSNFYVCNISRYETLFLLSKLQTVLRGFCLPSQ